jgi:hypothetical protein
MANWRRHVTIGRVAAVAFVGVGLYHAAGPWLFGYQGVFAPAVNHLAGGLVVAALGAVRVAGGRWAWWATGLAAAVGVWLILSPAVLDYGTHPLAHSHALWAGGLTLLFAGLAALARAVTAAQKVERQPG